MANTTNFGWETPDDTDLVKDGAAAIRTLGSAIDTSLLDLKGGTTDQVLAKNSNTDMDFKWVAQDDSNAIQNAIVDAKGDLISATGADTPARLAVGANDTVLTADSSTSTGLKWAAPAAGGMTLINTGGTALTGSSITIDTIPGTYKNLQLIVVNPNPASDADYLRVRINGDSNTRYRFFADDTTENIAFSDNTIYLTGAVDNGTADGIVYANFYDYANTSTWKLVEFASASNYYADTAKVAARSGHWVFNQTGAITSLVISFFGGNMDSGTAYLYGVK